MHRIKEDSKEVVQPTNCKVKNDTPELFNG